MDMARILVVDDEPAVREIMIELLRDGNHEPAGAATIRDAVSLLRDQEWHVVLADLVLSDGDGRKICREAAKIRVPCALMTGNIEILGELDAAGIPYLPKPFSAERLFAFLRPLLEYPSA
jgi:DNA-binding response OmpR family regulator